MRSPSRSRLTAGLGFGRICALLGAVALLWSAPARAQGDCRIPGAGKDILWVSAAPFAGVSVNVPTADPMHVRKATVAYGGEITLNLPKRFALGVLSSYYFFDGQNSLLEWVRHVDFVAVGHIPMIVRERIEWTLLVAAGTSMVGKQFLRNAKATYTETGETKFTGEVVRGTMWTLTGGIGSRLTFFPTDYLGIFVQGLTTYSYWKVLAADEGPCNAVLSGGIESHF